MAVLKIRLSDPDRERLGCDEWLPVDLGVLMQLEAEDLQRQIPDFDPDDWIGFLNSTSVYKVRVVVWCALRRAGVRVDLAELDFDREASLYRYPEPELPKDDSTPIRTSETFGEPTSPPSPTSSESSPPDPTEAPSAAWQT